MSKSQLSSNTTPENHSGKIRSAIDLLLSVDSINVVEPSVKLTECSPDIGVVMNEQGGICTNCNTLFKSKVSLMNHLISCNPSYNANIITSNSKNQPSKRLAGPKLVIINDR